MQSVTGGFPEPTTVSVANNKNLQVHPSVLEDVRKELSLEYEAKIKYMEDMCEARIMALQTSLAAANKGLASGDDMKQQQNLKFRFEEEDSFFARNIGASKPPQREDDGGGGGGNNHVINHVLREFEEAKQVFENDVQYLVDVNSDQQNTEMNPDVEFRKLKKRFCAWKKYYANRLEATKKTLRELGKEGAVENGNGIWKKWWGKKITGSNSKRNSFFRRE